MLISRRFNFTFIHIYKNAGTSITHALMPYAVCSAQQRMHALTTGRGMHRLASWLGYLNPALNPEPLPRHSTAEEVADYLGGERFSGFFSFAFVRNPWDWQVSLYNYALQQPRAPRHEAVKRMGSFEAFVEWRCSRPVRLQRAFVCDADGQFLVDAIGRYEWLERDFGLICARLGISATLPRLNVSGAIPYAHYYNARTADLVRQAFAPDIDCFGYDFDAPPQKTALAWELA